jgi:hypothetical protein
MALHDTNVGRTPLQLDTRSRTVTAGRMFGWAGRHALDLDPRVDKRNALALETPIIANGPSPPLQANATYSSD